MHATLAALADGQDNAEKWLDTDLGTSVAQRHWVSPTDEQPLGARDVGRVDHPGWTGERSGWSFYRGTVELGEQSMKLNRSPMGRWTKGRSTQIASFDAAGPPTATTEGAWGEYAPYTIDGIAGKPPVCAIFRPPRVPNGAL